MSFLDIEDDICDFCGNFFDVSGSHEIEVARSHHWCGECREGRDAIWGDISTDEIVKLRDEYQYRYDLDPIDWKDLYQSDSGSRTIHVQLSDDQIKRHRQQFAYSELVNILNQVLRDRGQQH